MHGNCLARDDSNILYKKRRRTLISLTCCSIFIADGEKTLMEHQTALRRSQSDILSAPCLLQVCYLLRKYLKSGVSFVYINILLTIHKTQSDTINKWEISFTGNL